MRRAVATIASALYLLVLAGFLVESVLGDNQFRPLSYFFKWDMFPAHESQSVRRIAVGRTASGHYAELIPSPLQQYRAGANSDLTRLDLDLRNVFNRPVIEETLRRAAFRPGDPVEHVFIFEKYWPDKFNYPDNLYQTWWGAPKPNRVGWRLLDEFDSP